METIAVRQDPSEMKYWVIWRLSPMQPNYFDTLFKYTKAFFFGLQHPELIIELEKMIKEEVEDKMGTPISFVLMVYENLPYLNSFTKSRNPAYENMYIYKYTIREWLNVIEKWIYQKLAELEGEIRFTKLKDVI